MSGDGVSGVTRGKYTFPRSQPYRGTLLIIVNKQVNYPDPILTQDLPRPRPHAGRDPHGREAVRPRGRKMAACRAEHVAVLGIGVCFHAVVGVGRPAQGDDQPDQTPSSSPSRAQHL